MLKFLGNFILVLVIFTFFADNAFAKPAPPKKLEGMFGEFSELEGKFKSGKWNEAKATLEEISESFGKMVTELKKNVKGTIVNDFEFILNNLKKSLAEKNLERSEKNYIALQKLFFEIMDVYEYKTPPIIKIIDKYINEAMEALEKNDFTRVLSEMDEVDAFFEQAIKLLEKKGMSQKDHDDFHAAVKDVISSGKAKDGAKAEAGLKKLKKLSARFLTLF
ncbi:MAG: hypothetical protein A2Z50_04060 [Nitrospirae bacterium RBG_19FT_COMBO_42_15]|nr:MAG: hypothetical protein A2Z50_04060 [Nitrospirae bacterium RBG_19FT_COMBO_42_15]